MSTESMSTLEKTRICLVEEAGSDVKTLEAARSLGLPLIKFDNFSDIINNSEWRTYFVFRSFEGPIFEMARNTKQCILGPPALQRIVKEKVGLAYNVRPTYNYSMRGAIICFTGMRNMVELRRLVNLIYSMGGCIRKEMNSKITHLIGTQSLGGKYHYAKTFNLTVVRPSWVYAAWEQRDELQFCATAENFSREHKLKSLEGLKICFFGFPAHELQHMMNVLTTNGGVSVELADPECSHVVIPYCLEKDAINHNETKQLKAFEFNTATANNETVDDDDVFDDESAHFDVRLVLDCSGSDITQHHLQPLHVGIDLNDNANVSLNENVDKNYVSCGTIVNASASNKISFIKCDQDVCGEKVGPAEDDAADVRASNDTSKSNELKRRHDSVDNLSMTSEESFAFPNTTKKAKLTNSGTIRRSLRRSMSFVGTPVLNMLKTRRCSLDQDPKSDFNNSTRYATDKTTCSIESSPKESLHEPIKEKLRSIYQRITRNTSKKEKDSISMNAMDEAVFKTPKTPKRFLSLKSAKTSTSKATTQSIFQSNEYPSLTDPTTTDMSPSSVFLKNQQADILAVYPKTHTQITCAEDSTPCNSKIFQIGGECSIQIGDNRSDTLILTSDWFWYTIQNGFANEMDYLFGDYLKNIANKPIIDLGNGKYERTTPRNLVRRCLSFSDDAIMSPSSNSFDSNTSSYKLETRNVCEATGTTELTSSKKSMRFNHFMELLKTESNYVDILDAVINLFKNPLEDMANSNSPLLNKTEIKAIFSNFVPIHEVHRSILQRLHVMQPKWTEDCLIGDIILQHRDQLSKAYPPYVNFYDQMQDTLQKCDSQNFRFHEFLKLNEAKPECKRESLKCLMIRPVQRLPGISLILNAILQHTNKNNPDFGKLEHAIEAITEVMTYVNEDKRKTESHLALFDIFNDIEDCPADLVSSQRKFLSKIEVTELSSNLSGRGDTLVLYLFSDTIEVCKKRPRGLNTSILMNTSKTHKHVKLISLIAISSVINITDSPNTFALVCRQHNENWHFFSIIDKNIDKLEYLKSLCKQVAVNSCPTDTVCSLLSRTSQELSVDIRETDLGTLSKAFKMVARTRLKFGRAFSYKKAPSMTLTSSIQNANQLTLTSQFFPKRPAIVTNIHTTE